MQKYYRASTCDIKRLCNISLSPIFAHLTDTFNGLQVIRALKLEES